MEIIDKETLHKLAQKYSQESIASAVIDIVVDDSDVNVEKECDLAEEMVKYIRNLEGIRIRLKEIHWSTTSNFEHEQTDQLIGAVMSFEDEIAEAFMGVCGFRFKPGEIVPMFPQCSEYKDVISLLSNSTLYMINKLSSNLMFLGVIDKLEDLYAYTNKMSYLSTQE
jgi:hypothetical protein